MADIHNYKKRLQRTLEKLSQKRNTTLTSITNDAIKLYLENMEYTFQDLLDVVDTIPAFSVSKEKIVEKMKNCPPIICKQIIKSI